MDEYQYHEFRKSDEIYKTVDPRSKEYYLEHYDEIVKKARAARENMKLFGEDYCMYYE